MISVKEIFATIQGEGSKAGTPAVFIRLSGCNLWSGNEHTRAAAKGACADWCDTDFIGGEKLSPEEVWTQVQQIATNSGVAQSMRWLVVITGGEPILQLRKPDGIRLLSLLLRQCTVAVETNGTVAIGNDLCQLIDHITVSPKPLKNDPASLDHIVVRAGQDLKVIMPSAWPTDALMKMREWAFRNKFVQPMDRKNEQNANLLTSIEHASILGWRLSVQLHKLLGLP